MIRFAADEDLDNHIVRGLRHRLVDIDILRVQDAALRSAPDADVLVWAALSGRVLLSHDASTMTAAAYTRIARGEAMPGVILIPQSSPVPTESSASRWRAIRFRSGGLLMLTHGAFDPAQRT